ncbi:MAG: alpha/beta hydrolase [Chloroflexaceae bacterium]|jgi:phospholipase/carboxylesterase/glyoxalase family protein|nr:alpha/beta hydrolase [Chloroflexaceae bacterium]
MTTQTLTFTHQFVPAERPGLPTLLLLHGTGGNEYDLLDLGRMLLPGAALLSPRGKVLEHGMPRFFRRLAEGMFDVEDLRFRTGELADFVPAAASAYDIDAGNVIAVGFSNGANIAASTMLLRPGTLAGAVLFHPMVPLEPEPLPNLNGTPVFIGAGTADPIVPRRNSERLAQLLRESGAAVTLYWQPGGHGLGQSEALAAQEWLGKL